MSLLHRIAIGTGDEARRTAANLVITKMADKQIKDWNARLLAEIHQKSKARGYVNFDGRFDQGGNG